MLFLPNTHFCFGAAGYTHLTCNVHTYMHTQGHFAYHYLHMYSTTYIGAYLCMCAAYRKRKCGSANSSLEERVAKHIKAEQHCGWTALATAPKKTTYQKKKIRKHKQKS